MKKIAFALFVIGLTACSSKKNWTKEYVHTKCAKGLEEKNKEKKLLSDAQIDSMCDCMADKMITQYKSEAEADKDIPGSRQIGTDCAREIMTNQ
jgi:hypothetical protein